MCKCYSDLVKGRIIICSIESHAKENRWHVYDLIPRIRPCDQRDDRSRDLIKERQLEYFDANLLI